MRFKLGIAMTFKQNLHPGFPSVVINTDIDKPLSKTRLSNKYSPAFLRILEYIYGSEGIISSGGIESIDFMLKDIDLDNKTLLDVGCGFGGVDIHLAKKFKLAITGVDSEPYMIECAEKLLKRSSVNLKGKILYHKLSDNFSLNEFADDSFDIVICKQVLYHVHPDIRSSYLKEIYRVLKADGKIVIEDLLVANKPYSDLVKNALDENSTNFQKREPFGFVLTPEEYFLKIINANFQNVKYIDITDQQVIYTEKDIQRIQESHDAFSKELGENAYAYIVKSWDYFISAMRAHELLSGIFIAKKI